MTRGLAALLLIAIAAPAHADLADATRERRVFRHLLVGMQRFPATRVTWVLYRGAQSVRLVIFCQEAKKDSQLGLRLDGQELDEARWLPPAELVYAGTRTATGYQLSAVSGAGSCRGAPSALTLTCENAKVPVLRAGAILVPGKKLDNDLKTPHRWRPATRRTIAAIRCQAAGGDWSVASATDAWRLVFAAGWPGVEWADEASDMVVQTGAYREISADRAK